MSMQAKERAGAGQTITDAVVDSGTMLRRNLKHVQRNPTILMLIIGVTVVFMLLFVYVFGEIMGAGVSGPSGDRSDYAGYIAPAIIVMAVAAAVQGTSIAVAMDMSEGIIARFRTMAIARASVLTGHVLGSLIQTVVGLVVVIGFAILVGFRPNATPVEWLAFAGLIVLFAFALIWLAVALGLTAKTVEGSSNLPMPLILLPFLGSGFVPTDSLPSGLQWFAENQPFTPVMETVRGLLTGTEIGNDGIIAVAWSVGIALVSYVWARNRYDKDPSARPSYGTADARA